MSSSRVIHRVCQEGLQEFLFGRLTDQEVGLAGEAFVSQKSRRWNWSFSVGGHSEDCIDCLERPPFTFGDGMFFWPGGHSEDCIGLP